MHMKFFSRLWKRITYDPAEREMRETFELRSMIGELSRFGAKDRDRMNEWFSQYDEKFVGISTRLAGLEDQLNKVNSRVQCVPDLGDYYELERKVSEMAKKGGKGSKGSKGGKRGC